MITNHKYRFIIFALLLSVITATAQGQKIRVADPNVQRESEDSKLNLPNNVTIIQKEIEKADTAYYSGIIRKNSWINGMGDSLSLEEALERDVYYRFSMKNKGGHWQHIECMSGDMLINGYGRLYFSYNVKSEGDIIKNDIHNKVNYSESSSATINDDINSICQWFEFSDLDGVTLVEERSYDKFGNLLFSMQVNSNKDERVSVSYTNRNGFPIDFDENARFRYGSVAAITYDSEGRDSVITYFDGAGNYRPSPIGVYRLTKKYDCFDRIISTESQNVVGFLMDDIGGVAIERFDYDTDGRGYKFSKFNKDNLPVKAHYDELNRYDNFQTKVCSLNQYGEVNKIEYFLNEDGMWVEDEVEGIHKIIIDKNGAYTALDKEGNMIEL